ncbi:MAG: hypothetical protein SXQ77_10425, partial [Halobacteria archaeon]|nr:hypothetical protein [Halobacteria archaeon]
PVQIEPEIKTFGANVVNSTISAGSSKTLELEITNNLNETLRNIEARLFTDSPIGTSDDEAYIPKLEPGESETISLGISASGSATPKMYSASIDFRYDDARNKTKVTDSYLIPVQVTESSGGGLPIVPIVIVLVLIG